MRLHELGHEQNHGEQHAEFRRGDQAEWILDFQVPFAGDVLDCPLRK